MTASTAHPDFHVENVVDGIYGPDKCLAFFHSDMFQMEQWLRIDFGGWKHAQFVEIHNRDHIETQYRISNSEIYIYGETPTENRQLCTKIIDGNHPVFYLPCVKTLYGKGMELYLLPHNNAPRILQVCQIIVLGY